MSEPIKWSEMTPDQRDALVHLKVMSNICTGKAGKHQRIYADGTPPTSWWYCSGCAKRWPEDPGEHSADIPPHYTTDMNAAWLVVEKFKQDGRGGYEFIQWQYHLGNLYGRPSYRDTLYDLNPEGVCIAGLRAVGVEIEPSAEPLT